MVTWSVAWSTALAFLRISDFAPACSRIRHTVTSRRYCGWKINEEVDCMLDMMYADGAVMEAQGMGVMGGTGGISIDAPHRQRAKALAMLAAGMAALFSLAATMLHPAYSDTLAGYGPSSPAVLYEEGGVTDVEMEMIEDVYEGVMASQDGSYCTEVYYPLSLGEGWVRALETCRFYSVKPGQIQLYYDGSGSELFRVSVSLGGPDMEAVRVKEAAYLAEVGRLVAEVEGKTAEEKVRFFHDYLVSHCEYDYSLTKSRAYDCLVDGASVCNGYAAAFYNLCRAAGLEAGYISGTVEIPGAGRIFHAWNRVKLEDGQWYYYDATWDDSTCSYQYYGLTEEGISRDHFPETVV